MTVDQYADAVEEAIEDRDLPSYKIYDLRSLVKFARMRNRVNRIDEVVLRWAGAPMGSPVIWTKPVTKLRQSKMF